MEAGLAFDAATVGIEGDALRGDGGVELGKGVEVLVDDGLVDVDPEGLGRLQLRRVGREMNEPDAFGHSQAGGGVPTGAVKHEDNDALAPRAGLAGEKREGLLEERLVDAGGEVPEALTGGGRDEGGDVEPLEAVMAGGDRTLAPRRPDPAGDRLQPDPVLVGGKGLDDGAGVTDGFLGDRRGEVLWNGTPLTGSAR